MSDHDVEAIISDLSYLEEVTLRTDRPRGEWVVEVFAEGSRRVLGIRYDGTWVIEPKDAPEAARIFAATVARMLADDPCLT